MAARTQNLSLFPTAAPAPVLAPPPVAAPAVSPAALWLAVHLPALTREVFVDAGETPFAVVAGEGGQVRIVAANVCAAARGVAPGQRLAAALALEPALQIGAREPAREEAALLRVAAWATQFTPVVVPEPPLTVLLEVRGSLALFGGLAALTARMQDGLAVLGHTARLGVAPTPRAAAWFARTGGAAPVTDPAALAGALGALALADLDWDARLVARLDGVGVRCLRDLLRLPRAGLARRYGRGLITALDQALGRAADPRPAWTPPPAFHAGLELPCESDDLGLLGLGAARLLEALTGMLVARALGVASVVLAFRHREPPDTVLRLGIQAATRDTARLAGLLHAQLERLRLRAPVRALSLSAPELVPLAARTADLCATPGTDHETRAVLLERLVARLGAKRVHHLACVADHRPEYAWRRVGGADHGETGGGMPLIAPSGDVPGWLLEVPEPLVVRDGRPVWQGPLRLLHGPLRLESGWWDGTDAVRDYFVAATRDHRRAWIYRVCTRPATWFLHGWFG